MDNNQIDALGKAEEALRAYGVKQVDFNDTSLVTAVVVTMEDGDIRYRDTLAEALGVV